VLRVFYLCSSQYLVSNFEKTAFCCIINEFGFFKIAPNYFFILSIVQPFRAILTNKSH
jgi:hypothetical protein